MGKLQEIFKNIFARRQAKTDITPQKANANELRMIIRNRYGDNIDWFASAYASSIYQIPEVRTAIQSFAEIFAIIPKYFERRDKDGNVTYLEGEEDRVINVRPNPL